MIKRNKFIFASVMLLSSLASLASCGGNDIGEVSEVQKVVNEAMTLSREDLFKKAAEELGDGTMKFIGTSSRFKNAIDSFKEELAKFNPKCANATITKDSTVDGQIYTKLLAEINSGAKDGYSGALVQDGFQLQKKGLDVKEGQRFINYIPKEWKEASDTNKELNGKPFSLQYNMKTWMFNNADGNQKVPDNVWDFTADSFKKKILTMDPNNENVNMDFLVMLTQDKWCDVLKEAYEDSSNDNKSIDFTKYASFGEKQKYAYAFIEKFIRNSSQFGDDGAARDALTPKTASGNGAWIVYSKIASVQETEAVSKKNVTICAFGNDNADGNTATMKMKGFGGFMYKHYLQVMPTCPKPWTVCAFINYLSTTAKGYAAWAKDIGDYPSMPSINTDRTKFGHGTLGADNKFTQKDSDPNVFPALNDPTSKWWEEQAKVVIEDPAYIAENYYPVKNFIDGIK